MQTTIVIIALCAITYASIFAVIVIRGNNYHSIIRSAVISELGIRALPYFENEKITRRITESYKMGHPAASVATALVLLIGKEEDLQS